MLRTRIVTGVLSLALVVGLAAPCFAHSQAQSAATPCCPEKDQAPCHNGRVADGCCQNDDASRNDRALSPWAAPARHDVLGASFVAPGAVAAAATHDSSLAFETGTTLSTLPPLRSCPLLI